MIIFQLSVRLLIHSAEYSPKSVPRSKSFTCSCLVKSADPVWSMLWASSGQNQSYVTKTCLFSLYLRLLHKSEANRQHLWLWGEAEDMGGVWRASRTCRVAFIWLDGRLVRLGSRQEESVKCGITEKADAAPGDPRHLDMIEDLKEKTCVTWTQLHIQNLTAIITRVEMELVLKYIYMGNSLIRGPCKEKSFLKETF